MMRFKKIYIEITNCCNLNCNFCIGNNRKKKFIKLEQFKFILTKIKPYTKYIYLHILGEPLLHPKINELIDEAVQMGFYVNVTTNGYLINKLSTNNIRQINISLHSFNYKNKVPLDKYLQNIFDKIDKFPKTYISLRIWANNSATPKILNYLEKKFNTSIKNINNCKLSHNIYLSIAKQFTWPNLNNKLYNETGTCHGLIDHIGILVDGSIVPCCLDSSATIYLGNIFETDLETILKKPRVINMINGFKNNKKCEELCHHCNFNEIKKKN